MINFVILIFILTSVYSITEIFTGPLNSCLERCIGLRLGIVGQRGMSYGEDSGIMYCEQHLSSVEKEAIIMISHKSTTT